MNPNRLIELSIFAGVMTLAVILASLLGGCAGSKGHRESVVTIVYPDGSTYTRDTRARVETVAPSNAQESSPVTITDDGVAASTAATWQQTVDQVVAGQSRTLYVIAAVLAAGAALALWKGQGILAGGLAVAAAGFGLLPFVGPRAAAPLAVVAVVAVIAGIVWAAGRAFGWWRAIEQEKTATTEQAVEDLKGGQLDAAVAKFLTLPRVRKVAKAKGVVS